MPVISPLFSTVVREPPLVLTFILRPLEGGPVGGGGGGGGAGGGGAVPVCGGLIILDNPAIEKNKF